VQLLGSAKNATPTNPATHVREKISSINVAQPFYGCQQSVHINIMVTVSVRVSVTVRVSLV